MKIHFLTSAHNSLSQRLLIELEKRGHQVSVTLASSDAAMLQSVAEQRPDLIIAPMLKCAIPEAIWGKHLCLIVHPGIVGDRGPSSLDWAIMNGEKEWGVSILQAAAEFDAGPIWAARTFALKNGPCAKSSLYRHEVTEAAVEAVLEAVWKFETEQFSPEPLDYGKPGVRGRLCPPMRQGDRTIDWRRDSTETILRKIGAADSTPGVLDDIWCWPFYLYGAHPEDRLTGVPGQPLAQRDDAVCRATIDGAIWITHLKAKGEDGRPGIKLPAVQALGPLGKRLPISELPIDAVTDYRTYREISYREENGVGYLSFDFLNGAMSTEQCYRLRDAFLFARSQPTRVIVLLGGKDFFSNGIHLNVIEVAADPALESWRNINAIDDLIYEILNTMSHIVIAALRGNAGAGGAMLPLAADRVFAREGIILNPHYKSMGGLYGSEYWTYTLPRRVGHAKAFALTEACRPLGTLEAKAIGFIDECLAGDADTFEQALTSRAEELALGEDSWRLLRQKHDKRLADERVKPLAAYRAEELKHMHFNFYGADKAYHLARQEFVYKRPLDAGRQRIRPAKARVI
ncbi:MAG TPA: hydrogenase maturation protein [Methylocella sp.]|nr:hydrogenase maturation protein [Methylocella sp.]